MSAKVQRPLTAVAVARLIKPGAHAVGGTGCAGLCLSVTSTTVRSWVLRVTVNGARRSFGLGSYPTVSLAQAREAAKAMRALTDKGIDPKAQAIAAREAARAEASAAKAAADALITFGAAAGRYITAHERAWTRKHAEQWRASLNQHALPTIGEAPVSDIATHHVLAAVKPIWESRTETANRVAASRWF